MHTPTGKRGTGLRSSYLQLVATGFSPCSLNLQSQFTRPRMSLCMVSKAAAGRCDIISNCAFTNSHSTWSILVGTMNKIGARWPCLKRAGCRIPRVVNKSSICHRAALHFNLALLYCCKSFFFPSKSNRCCSSFIDSTTFVL